MSLTEQNLLDPAALMVSHLHCRSLASHISYLPLKAKHPEEGDHVNYYISLHKCVYFGCGPPPRIPVTTRIVTISRIGNPPKKPSFTTTARSITGDYIGAVYIQQLTTTEVGRVSWVDVVVVG